MAFKKRTFVGNTGIFLKIALNDNCHPFYVIATHQGVGHTAPTAFTLWM